MHMQNNNLCFLILCVVSCQFIEIHKCFITCTPAKSLVNMALDKQINHINSSWLNTVHQL